jgi:hypothetical protein
MQTHITPQPPTIAAANEPEDGFPCHLPSASPVPEAQERQMAEEGFTFEEADALQMQCCLDLPSTFQMFR